MRKAECGKEGRWGPGEKGGKKEVGKMGRWEDERVGEKAGVGDGEVLKVELGMRPPARRGHRAYAPEEMRYKKGRGGMEGTEKMNIEHPPAMHSAFGWC